MKRVRNASAGPRGAYLRGQLIMAEPGEAIDADDFAEEWFEAATPDPLDHDGDGRRGGSKPGAEATRTRAKAKS